MRYLIAALVAAVVAIACQKIVVINDSPGDHELEAPSPVHVDMDIDKEVNDEGPDDPKVLSGQAE